MAVAQTGTVEATSREFEFEWKILCFNMNLKEGYISQIFSCAGTTWCMKVYPTRFPEYNSFVYVGVYLIALSDFTSRFQVSFKIKTADAKKDEKRYAVQIPLKTKKVAYGIYKFVSKDELTKRARDLLPSNHLTIVCSIKLLESNENAVDDSLSQDLKKMLLEGKNHDVILKIGDKELRAHRDILRARSHVFQSMLDHDMKEETGVIQVNDCDPQAMEAFLSYVYTGKVEMLDQSNAFALYYIADKYDVQSLKDKCSDFIEKTFSNTNICQAIQLAVDHNDSTLLEKASEYFFKNALDITLTVEWQTFLKDNTTLGNEIFVKFLKKLKDTKS